MLMLIVSKPVAPEQILGIAVLFLTVGVCVKGLWEKEELKKIGAKFLFGALLAVIVKEPKLFFTIGEKIAGVITYILSIFG